MELERRTFTLKEIRVMADPEGEHESGPKIYGYAAVFNQLSSDLGGFRERILPNAFGNSIRVDDVRALFNHDPNYVLGRNVSGTLKLEEDEHGLRIEINPPDAQWAKDLVASLKRGDIDQMSFGFRTISDDWHKENDEVIRELIEVQLFDVSPVTYPAYPQTVVHARDLLNAHQAELSSGQEEVDSGQESETEGESQERSRKLDLAKKRLDLLKELTKN
jgi:hypothetical protein